MNPLLTSVSPHMITKQLPTPTPIHTLMDQFTNGKGSTVNEGGEFNQVFSTDYLSNSDNDAHYDNSNLSDTHNSVSEDEFLINYNFGTNMVTQPAFTNDMMAQGSLAPSYDFDSRLTSSKFDWSNFHDTAPAGSISGVSMNSMPILVNNPSDPPTQRRPSLPEDGEANDFHTMNDLNPRKRIFSWAEMNHSNYFGSDMDFSQSVRRSSVNIPLQDMRNPNYLDPYTGKDATHLNANPTNSVPSRNSFPLDDALSNSPSFPSDDTFKHKSKTKKSRENPGLTPGKKHSSAMPDGNEPDIHQTVVEKRLNRRRERNRLAARRSREKRTQFLRDLEGLNDSLRSENNALKGKLCEVLRELEILRGTTTTDGNPHPSPPKSNLNLNLNLNRR